MHAVCIPHEQCDNRLLHSHNRSLFGVIGLCYFLRSHNRSRFHAFPMCNGPLYSQNKSRFFFLHIRCECSAPTTTCQADACRRGARSVGTGEVGAEEVGAGEGVAGKGDTGGGSAGGGDAGGDCEQDVDFVSGLALFRLHSCINHSCCPNAHMTFSAEIGRAHV